MTAQKTTEQVLTPERMIELYRLSAPSLSPDESHFLYSRSRANIASNSSESEILIGNTEHPMQARVLLEADLKAHSATFLDRSTVVYISSAGSDHAQIWKTDLAGNRTQLSNFDFDVEAFLFSPDRKQVVVIREVNLPSKVHTSNPDLPKATGMIITDLMYKHWDHWVASIPKPYIAQVASDLKVDVALTPLLGENEWYEVPTRPFSGIEDLSWSTDSKKIAYSCRKKTGLEYAVSTNTDIYIYDTETKKTTNLTEGMMGYDTQPTYSPDGKYIAWVSMERDGYEADLKRIFVADLKSGLKREVTVSMEYYADQIAWRSDSRAIRFLSKEKGLGNIFEIPLEGKRVSPLTEYDMADVTGFSGSKDKLVYGLQSMKDPTDIFLLRIGKKKENIRLTEDNKANLSSLANISVEKRWITTTDGKKMLTWVVFPPNFDRSKKYPTILYCQGGPQSTVSQFWSVRWNLRTFASHGYIIVAPNRRGVPGFGKEWNEQISGDYGGQNMRDYFSAIDAVAKEPYVDKERLGATGASYGGFSVFWIAGHHQKRFKAFFAHAGMFNLESQYLETEEKFFVNWDLGGPYWEKGNPAVQHSYANSPHLFVDKWDTPICISHGELDYRILASQGMMAFDAAKIRGIDTELLLFPDENHWILQPQNSVLFYRTWFNWMDKYLKR